MYVIIRKTNMTDTRKKKIVEERKRMKDYLLKDIEYFKVWGRNVPDQSPLALFWTGSALECNVKASELWVEIEADYEVYEPWLGIMINEAYVSRQMLNKGRQWICVFRGMNPETIKNVRLVKEVQPMPGDDAHAMLIHSLRTDGSFMPIEEKPYKIEIIGDSITSGEGSVGAKKEEEWISMWFSAQNNYARMTAELMNAEYRIVSQSGWGIYTGWDNNPNAVIPKYYETVCGVINGEKNRKLGAFERNDFTSWQPDAVVINLGTNDGEAFNSPAWTDPDSGKTYKQRINVDGSYNDADLKHIKEAMIDFLKRVRKHNSKAYILWVYGMLGAPILELLREGMNDYVHETQDKRAAFLQLEDTTKEQLGARQHPGLAAHQKAAQIIANHLKRVLNK